MSSVYGSDYYYELRKIENEVIDSTKEEALKIARREDTKYKDSYHLCNSFIADELVNDTITQLEAKLKDKFERSKYNSWIEGTLHATRMRTCASWRRTFNDILDKNTKQ